MARYAPFRDWPGHSPLYERCERTPDRTALIDTETDTGWTYEELTTDVAEIASRLREHVDPEPESGDRPRVGYVLPPGPEFVTTLHALWDLGWTVVGLHTDLTPRELETHATIADVDAIVVEESSDSLQGAVDCPILPIESLMCSEGGGLRNVRKPLQLLDGAEWGREDTALVLFTSGTTGEPKGVRLTLRNLLTSATASAFRLGVTPTDRWLCCLPVSHMGGLAPAVRTVLYGTTLIVQRQFETTETAGILEEYSITDVSLVPTQLKRLLDGELTPPASLKTVLLGGAPATDDLLDRAESRGVPVYPTYGMTEAASQIATARPGERQRFPDTVGQPLLSAKVTILEEGEPVTSGETGEIVVDGPTVMPGYLDEGKTAKAFGEYGFHTGDVGYRDDNGRLWVVGRVDDVILSGGELVAPAEVAEVLRSMNAVEDAAVVGVPDEEWGERVAALVVSVDGVDLNEKTLREACGEQLAAYKVPKTIDVGEEIPRTGSGTVDREAVRERLGER